MKYKESLGGAIVHNREKVCPGPRLYNGRLIDLNGRILRRWDNRYLSLISNGFYYAQQGYEQQKWGKYSLDGRAIWEKNEAIHHELLVHGDKIITFTKECRPYRGRLVDFDVIVEYDLNGARRSSWSTWENLKYLKTFHKALELDLPRIFFLPDIVPPKQTTPWGGQYDYYRLNSLQVVPKNNKRFMEGYWLVTLRHGSMIFVIDGERKIVWKAVDKDISGNIEGPHGAQVLSSGNILIFDNGRYRKSSRVIEIDPFTKKVIWQYTDHELFTLSQGYAQRLPNGNTLITESERGHVLEVTLGGEIVWEFLNPQLQCDPKFPQSQGTREWIYRMIWYPDVL